MEKQDTPQQNLKPSPNKSNNQNTILIVFLVVLLLTASGVASYAFYQNTQLKKQIAQFKTTPTPSPISVNSPSPTTKPSPILEVIPSSSNDESCLLSKQTNISFCYPNNLTKPSVDLLTYDSWMREDYTFDESNSKQTYWMVLTEEGGYVERGGIINGVHLSTVDETSINSQTNNNFIITTYEATSLDNTSEGYLIEASTETPNGLERIYIKTVWPAFPKEEIPNKMEIIKHIISSMRIN